MSRYEAEFETPDGVDPYSGSARIEVSDGVHHTDPDEAAFPALDIEGVNVFDTGDVRLYATCHDDVAALREHLTAALDDLDKAVDEYIAADPKRTTAPPA
jgi:hypothetical protein